MADGPGLRQKFYLGGYEFAANPDSFIPTATRAETRQRARDGSLMVHRPRRAAGEPNLLSKFVFTLSWSVLKSADAVKLNSLIAGTGTYNFCPWMLWTERFTFLNGESVAGSLLRGDARTEIGSLLPPGTPATDYAATATLGGTAKTLSLAAMANGRTAFTLVPPATSSGSQVLEIVYAPYFTVYVAEGQRSFSLPSISSGTLTLEEW